MRGGGAGSRTDPTGGRVAAPGQAEGPPARDRRTGDGQRLPQRCGGQTGKQLCGAQLYSGEEAEETARLAGQTCRAAGGLREPATGPRRVRQELDPIKVTLEILLEHG